MITLYNIFPMILVIDIILIKRLINMILQVQRDKAIVHTYCRLWKRFFYCYIQMSFCCPYSLVISKQMIILSRYSNIFNRRRQKLTCLSMTSVLLFCY